MTGGVVSGMGYDFAEMVEHRAELLRIIKAIDSQVKQATTSVHKFCTGWQGEAREAFDAQYRTWTEAADNLLENMAYVHQVVTVAHGNYAYADKAVLTVWGGEG
jgi:WXG100 family type VII secretion target